MINIRCAGVNDAELLSIFIKQLDLEGRYLLYEPDERKNDTQMVRAYLLRMTNGEKSVVYIAENDHKHIVGFVCGEVSHLNRISHVMKANIGVLKKYHGWGIGRMLTEQLLLHAKRVGIYRMEVTVIKDNKMSLNLCKKFGFEIEGLKRNSIKISDKLYDECLLSKLIM